MAKEDDQFTKKLEASLEKSKQLNIEVVLKGQYARAYELLENSVAASLTPIMIGPVGIGKSILVRKFAQDTGRRFYEVFFDELMRPAHLIGSFDPALVLNKGYCLEAFEAGPLLRAMVEGGIFVAQELNRATEYCQNSLLEPLEERSYHVPKIGRIFAHEDFLLIATANPAELAGTHRFSEALRDRLRVWIPLGYPERSVELEIIRVNLGGYVLENAVLERVHDILYATRNRNDIEQPASLRAGISISRLCAQHLQKHGKLTDKDISEYAKNVLFGAMKLKTPRDSERIIDEVVNYKRMDKRWTD